MRKYNAEFKREAIRLAEESEQPIKQIEKELGLYDGAIRTWRRELREDPDSAFPGTGNLKPAEEEMRQLRKELERVKRERDILKKALAIFSKEPNRYIDS